ncbi:MAG: hypothetical protein OWV35_03070 [Firmicutes bacterium]|nr:hypothetical protein [Bacillota bacterium]
MRAGSQARFPVWLRTALEAVLAAGLLITDFPGALAGHAPPAASVDPRPVAAGTLHAWLAAPPGTAPNALQLVAARLPAAAVARLVARDRRNPAWVAEVFTAAAMDRRYRLAAALAGHRLAVRLIATAAQAAVLARQQGLSGRVEGLRALARTGAGSRRVQWLLVGFDESLAGHTWPVVSAEVAVSLRQVASGAGWEVSGLQVAHERALAGPWTASPG